MVRRWALGRVSDNPLLRTHALCESAEGFLGEIADK